MTFKVISEKKKENFIVALMPTDNDNDNDEASEMKMKIKMNTLREIGRRKKQLKQRKESGRQ